jgi:hypothetical protein
MADPDNTEDIAAKARAMVLCQRDATRSMVCHEACVIVNV